MMSTIQRPEGIRVTHRRVQLELDSGFDRYWHSGSAFKSLFWDQLSASFESGERVFIDATRALKHMATDPALQQEIAEFCRQEGQHTAQHVRFDRANERLGIDIPSVRARWERILGRLRRASDDTGLLAATCALEHLTSTVADSLLTDPKFMAGADPRVAALWTWHAVEESEHCSTCIDLYRASNGSHEQRVRYLTLTWSFIAVVSLANTMKLLHQDGRLLRWDTLMGLRYLFGRGGLFARAIPAFLAYRKPDFQPWSGDEGRVIARWLSANQRYLVPRGTRLSQLPS